MRLHIGLEDPDDLIADLAAALRVAMSGRDQEYDRFGPWVIEISAADPAPRLFEPHLTRTDAPLLAVKIPRKIARREAHPGMDLYDYVVSLYEDDMLILRRADRAVQADTITYRDIQHLRVREDLLRGSVHLGLPEHPLELPYNTVSGDIMKRLVGLIRERYQVPGWTPLQPSPGHPVGGLSFYFEGLLASMRAEGSAMRTLAAQADTALGSLKASRLQRALFGLVDKRLLESLHLTDGRELRVIDRGQPYVYRWQAVYGRSETCDPARQHHGRRLGLGHGQGRFRPGPGHAADKRQ